MEAPAFRDLITDAIRYWEPRRIAYNALLAAIVLLYFGLGYPASLNEIRENGLFLFLLAVLANVAYCAAYVPDIFAQASGFRDGWRKYRWVVFVVGLVFAGIITRFWAIAFFVTTH